MPAAGGKSTKPRVSNRAQPSLACRLVSRLPAITNAVSELARQSDPATGSFGSPAKQRQQAPCSLEQGSPCLLSVSPPVSCCPSPGSSGTSPLFVSGHHGVMGDLRGPAAPTLQAPGPAPCENHSELARPLPAVRVYPNAHDFVPPLAAGALSAQAAMAAKATGTVKW